MCRHSEDRVPLYTSLKSIQGVGCASTRCHVSCSFGPHLPTKVRSGATTCLTAPDLTSLISRGSGAATCPMALGSASSRGELRCCHVPHGPSELWTTGMKKCLAGPDTQLSSHVSKARLRITEAPAWRADRPLQFGSTMQHSPS
jgi:hypothetical protein